jgi:hypothetical protein
MSSSIIEEGILVRLPADIAAQLAELAESEFRTPEAQAAALIRDGIRRSAAMTGPRPVRDQQASLDLAARMQELRLEAGHPSTRVIAEGCGMTSHTTVAEFMRGKRLASWATVSAVVTFLGGDPADYKESWIATRNGKQ